MGSGTGCTMLLRTACHTVRRPALLLLLRRALLARLQQLEHQRGGRQQHQGMQRDQREQRHQPLRPVDQADERHADHHRVAEHVRQGARRRCRGQAAQHQRGDKKQPGRAEIQRHGGEVQLLQAHLAHGAKQQCRGEHQEDDVGQVGDGAGAHPADAGNGKAQADAQDDGGQGSKDGEEQDARKGRSADGGAKGAGPAV